MALLGLDVAGLLDRALVMQRACGPFIPAERNPGLHLGALLGLATRKGRDKVTFAPSRSLGAFGAWAEQLLAESTGKGGRGLIPVDGEPPGLPDVYGEDRLFVGLREAGDSESEANAFLEARTAEGHPILRIELSDPLDIGAEFLRWEAATSVAGSILDINPFDEPNVAESKRNTSDLLKQWGRDRSFPEARALAGDEWITLFGEPGQSWLAQQRALSSESLLQQFLASARPRDYIALLAYVHRTQAIHELLTSFRVRLRERLRIATTLGYGPRYLHSTGQLHKGGPNTGLFLLLTADSREDVPIPAEPYGFATLQRAQALGDYRALAEKGRRVLRIHLRGEVRAAVVHLAAVLQSALTREATKVR
jgi:hypothetical protein